MHGCNDTLVKNAPNGQVSVKMVQGFNLTQWENIEICLVRINRLKRYWTEGQAL